MHLGLESELEMEPPHHQPRNKWCTLQGPKATLPTPKELPRSDSHILLSATPPGAWKRGGKSCGNQDLVCNKAHNLSGEDKFLLPQAQVDFDY